MTEQRHPDLERDEVDEALADKCGCWQPRLLGHKEGCDGQRLRHLLVLLIRDAEERGVRAGRALGLGVAREVVASELRRHAQHALADTMERALVQLAGEPT